MSRLIYLLTILVPVSLFAADRSLKNNPELANYFEHEVRALEQANSLQKYETLEQWEQARPELRTELFDMLGMNPMPERSPLNATVTGTVEEADFVVERLQFQSMPGLYVTGNFYRPKNVTKPLPTVLYVCGHAVAKEGGISFGNKTGYQHHGAWYARHGYTCLTIDTIQLGEIGGLHHGTYSHNRWWWNARGYTPAGVEAWNCMRALDYLETRSEVDTERMGVTGRSGGGAYSWWIAALDDRIKCAVPVAGITSLRNHVVDNCIEGHCDCMFMVHTYRWDYEKVAALVAPRPLLISNSDKDTIFPLSGVVDIHRRVKHIYDLYKKPKQLGLNITEGPHLDTQELRIHAFRWMNRWLKNDESLISAPAVKFFEPAQLRVFGDLPADERVTSIDESFVPEATLPQTADVESIVNRLQDWAGEKRTALRKFCFAAWPDDSKLNLGSTECDDAPLSFSPAFKNAVPDVAGVRHRFESQAHVRLSFDLLSPQTAPTKSAQLLLLNDEEWSQYQQQCLLNKSAGNSKTNQQPVAADSIRERIQELMAAGSAVAVFAPRGAGPHAWIGNQRKQTQIRRRFQMIGATIDGMRVWDVRRAIRVLRQELGNNIEVTIEGRGESGWLAIAALIFDDGKLKGNVSELSSSRNKMPVFLNVARYFTPHELLLLASATSELEIANVEDELVQFVDSAISLPSWAGKNVRIK